MLGAKLALQSNCYDNIKEPRGVLKFQFIIYRKIKSFLAILSPFRNPLLKVMWEGTDWLPNRDCKLSSVKLFILFLSSIYFIAGLSYVQYTINFDAFIGVVPAPIDFIYC